MKEVEMSKRCHSVLTSAALVAAVVTATSVFGIATAAAGGPPQGGGGCHMVFGPAFHSPNSSGLDNMMAGSGGSTNGIGAENMGDMLSRFSDEPFCGL
jgi:hypothetical protein